MLFPNRGKQNAGGSRDPNAASPPSQLTTPNGQPPFKHPDVSARETLHLTFRVWPCLLCVSWRKITTAMRGEKRGPRKAKTSAGEKEEALLLEKVPKDPRLSKRFSQRYGQVRKTETCPKRTCESAPTNGTVARFENFGVMLVSPFHMRFGSRNSYVFSAHVAVFVRSMHGGNRAQG